MTRLVLLGGGHAHLAVLASLAREPIAGLSVRLVTPEPRAIYSGMLPGWVSGRFSLDECAIDLPALAAAARTELHLARADAVDAAARSVALEQGSPLAYDVLSLDVGSIPAAGDVDGVARYAIPVRPLAEFVEGWERVRHEAMAGRVRAVSVVGGGAAGVELALAMACRLRRDIPHSPPHVRILTDAPAIVPTFPSLARSVLHRRLDAAGIGVHGNCPVREVGRDFIRAGEALTFANDATFWVTGPAPHRFLRQSGFRLDARGFLSVNACQQSESHAEVFAAGDCATRVDAPLPKSGVFAVRAGPVLAMNLRAYLAGQPLRAHRSRRLHLALLATGEGSAVGAWGPLSFSGQWVGRWKDRIDREFIARYAAPKPG